MAASPEQARINGRKGGRKKGSKATHTIEASEMRKRLVEFVAERLQPLLEAKMDMALGVYEAITDKDGKVINAYKKLPDAASIRYFLDQSVGKATETVKVTEDITLKIDV